MKAHPDDSPRRTDDSATPVQQQQQTCAQAKRTAKETEPLANRTRSQSKLPTDDLLPHTAKWGPPRGAKKRTQQEDPPLDDSVSPT